MRESRAREPPAPRLQAHRPAARVPRHRPDGAAPAASGIVLMFLGDVFNVLFGVLTVSFVLVAVTGIVLVLVFLRREANLSELQADFVSKVSHELRTPLTEHPPLRRDHRARPRRPGAPWTSASTRSDARPQRLTRRIERLLDWGRMEAGRKQYELQDASPSRPSSTKPSRRSSPSATATATSSSRPRSSPTSPTVERRSRRDGRRARQPARRTRVKYGGTPPW